MNKIPDFVVTVLTQARKHERTHRPVSYADYTHFANILRNNGYYGYELLLAEALRL